jgi:hypothetical protein
MHVGETPLLQFSELRACDIVSMGGAAVARRMDNESTGGRVMKDSKKRPRRTRGAVMVEYAFLLVFVMVPTAGVLLAGGRAMYQYYLTTRTAVLNSTP